MTIKHKLAALGSALMLTAAGAAFAGSGGGSSAGGSAGGSSAGAPGADGGSTTLTQPGTAVMRGIPGETGAAAGASSTSGAMTEAQIRGRLSGQGHQVDDLVRRGDAWEGRIMRDGRAETVRIDPLTGQLLNR